MKEQHKHIEQLIVLFLEGATTNAQEEELFNFFSGDSIPEHLHSYKPIFAWFGRGIGEEFSDLPEVVLPVPPKPRFRLWATVSLVAATVGVLFFLRTSGHAEIDPYEGSYMVINGVVITDPALVRPAIQATLQAVGQQQQEIDRILYQAHRAELEYLYMQKSLEMHFQDILNDLPDDQTRHEVFHLLYSTN